MKIGDGRTEAEQQIELAIARIDDWQGKTVSYERISTGITNLNWKINVREDGRNYFMKLHGANTSIFIDRALAHEAALKVGETGLAPRLLHSIASDGIEVFEFLEGYHSANVSDLFNPVVRGNIIRAYRDIHRTQSLSRAKPGFEQLAERLEQVRQYGADLPRDIDYLLWQAERARAAVDRMSVTLCACYNDGYVSNYMIGPHGSIRIIDWEYAANNDPYWDLAMVAFESFFSPAMIREMIVIHDDVYTAEAGAKIVLYGGLIGITWGLWAALQSTISSIPFDFAKYSDQIFLRTRHLLRQPVWEEALAPT